VINHASWHLAMRNKALLLSVATTGTMALAAVSTGYTRLIGSFVTDGFLVGQEVQPAGFGSNTPRVITSVTALALGVSGTLATDASAAGRSLTVGLPALRYFENLPLTPVAGRPYVREQYLPGGAPQRITLGPLGELEALPIYSLQVYAMPGVDVLGPKSYADALITLFAPGTILSASNGDSVVVRSDLCPFPGQLLQDEAGWAVIPVTIPFRVRTPNSI
jgi:hypothetical protein